MSGPSSFLPDGGQIMFTAPLLCCLFFPLPGLSEEEEGMATACPVLKGENKKGSEAEAWCGIEKRQCCLREQMGVQETEGIHRRLGAVVKAMPSKKKSSVEFISS